MIYNHLTVFSRSSHMTALRKSIQNALAVLILVELKYSVELRFAFSKGPYFYSHNCHILLTISEKKRILKQSFGIHKDIFACLFSIHNTIGLSRHEQVCLSGLRFERYFSHHRARWWEKYLSKRSPLKHTCSWRDKLIVLQSFGRLNLIHMLLEGVTAFSITSIYLIQFTMNQSCHNSWLVTNGQIKYRIRGNIFVTNQIRITLLRCYRCYFENVI